MNPLARAERFERAKSVGEMTTLLRTVLSGDAERDAIFEFTRRLWPDTSRQGGPFEGHGQASVVFDSIWNVLDQRDGAYFVRDHDLREYVRWLTEGELAVPQVAIARCRLRANEIAARLALPTVRYWIGGLGPQETVRFGSPGTGRAFVATSAWWSGEASEASLEVDDADRGQEALDDLFDTLSIDFADVTWAEGAARTRWQLWRQDDNGIRVLVDTLTGYGKAQAVLASFERLGHKQSYWVEEAPT